MSQKEGLAGADPENSERAGVAAIIDSYIDTVQFTENSIKNAKFHRKGGRGVGGRNGRSSRPHPKSAPMQPGVQKIRIFV